MSAIQSVASAFVAALRAAIVRLGFHHSRSLRAEQAPSQPQAHDDPVDAVAPVIEAYFEPMTAARLDAVMAIEYTAYSHPWSSGNFTDAVAAGYLAQCLLAGNELLGYFVAMPCDQEVHLLNITVAPAFQRQGWARVMLDALVLWSRGRGAEWLWLEVRASNERALKIYEQQGFARVGIRKGYYPLRDNEREDAVVMNLGLK
jgi:ribosomal-protein-alanine N-acetyltransferase